MYFSIPHSPVMNTETDNDIDNKYTEILEESPARSQS